jgi:hypothetical protein
VSLWLLGSVKGAPGVTTAALAMAAVWVDGQVTVAELDMDGGVLAARRGLGLEPGLVTLAADLRHGMTPLDPHLQPLSDTVDALVAPASPQQMHTALAVAGTRVWAALDRRGDAVLVDGGRLRSTGPTGELARRATATLLVARPRLEDVALLRGHLPTLRRAGVRPLLVLADDGPYTATDVAAAVDAEVVGELPRDPRAAGALNGGTGRRALRRSPLLRAARTLTDALTDLAPRQPPAAAATFGPPA